MLSSTTWHDRTIVIAEAYYGRGENSIDVARTQWQRSEKEMQSSPVRIMLVLSQWSPY